MNNLNVKKILVIGSGGRENAICEAFKNSSQVTQIFALPGNAGTKNIAKNIENINIKDSQAIINFCQENQIDFVFIGPEQPLVEGLVDILENHKIRVFGPSKKASQLEGSKIFMKKIADDNNVPTAQYQTFEETKPALEFVKKIGFPCVIKADGLASGKGVIIAQNFEEATSSVEEILSGKFGDAGKKIIIEEFLKGFEVSYFVICDGKNFLPLGFAHDHKKVGENETGLNTGGMGTFAPSPFVNKQMEAIIIEKIIIPTLDGMNKINAPFRGILFAGLMIDGENPKLLEFNTRFGDPETQVLLPRIKSDFVALIESAIDGDLGNFKIEFDEEKKLVCVVICSNGYPEDYKKNIEIKNLRELEKRLEKGNIVDGVKILHAGTVEKDGKILAIGGRVLNIVASDKNFLSARQKAYKIIDMIGWKDGFARKDIAKEVID